MRNVALDTSVGLKVNYETILTFGAKTPTKQMSRFTVLDLSLRKTVLFGWVNRGVLVREESGVQIVMINEVQRIHNFLGVSIEGGYDEHFIQIIVFPTRFSFWEKISRFTCEALIHRLITLLFIKQVQYQIVLTFPTCTPSGRVCKTRVRGIHIQFAIRSPCSI
jgi:hypothetical protein